MVKILVKKFDKNIKLPTYKTSGSSGMDLVAYIKNKIIINPGKSVMIPTGIAVAIPNNYEIQIRPRSGLAAKKGVSVLNTPGTIDSDYRGEIKIILINLSKKLFIVKSGDRIAQMILCPVAKGKFNHNIIEFKNIFRSEPPIDSPYHFGSRLIIKDKHLFITAGERGKGMIAQDASKHPGSIIRINLDGSIPKDNPKFKIKKGWLPEIYQIGVRNPQGMSLSPFDNKIYLSNHGAKGGDWFGEVKFGGATGNL